MISALTRKREKHDVLIAKRLRPPQRSIEFFLQIFRVIPTILVASSPPYSTLSSSSLLAGHLRSVSSRTFFRFALMVLDWSGRRTIRLRPSNKPDLTWPQAVLLVFLDRAPGRATQAGTGSGSFGHLRSFGSQIFGSSLLGPYDPRLRPSYLPDPTRPDPTRPDPDLT